MLDVCPMQTRLLHLVLEHCSLALSLNNRYVKALTRRLKAYETLGMKKEALLGTDSVCDH